MMIGMGLLFFLGPSNSKYRSEGLGKRRLERDTYRLQFARKPGHNTKTAKGDSFFSLRVLLTHRQACFRFFLCQLQ
ncbi:hypothetical protein BDB00DRAFT_817434 [Zychaea mexicana]|uniref:uncharacterized protein n=1 Tax=Zychaea mexicana TaxID=64656 RepID=UPI0022FE8A59|nr:uncharacterized protein BDB00DRAFT_817434 [Zychaea mexicana]KAI9494594.1 hypothetical protein BDB00DRAFT_817434 [Zychaea mexicana]